MKPPKFVARLARVMTLGALAFGTFTLAAAPAAQAAGGNNDPS